MFGAKLAGAIKQRPLPIAAISGNLLDQLALTLGAPKPTVARHYNASSDLPRSSDPFAKLAQADCLTLRLEGLECHTVEPFLRGCAYPYIAYQGPAIA